MLHAYLFCNMKPGSRSNLRTHLSLYVDEYAKDLRDAHPKKRATYATKYNHKHHVAMIRYWIGRRQTSARIPELLAVELEYSKDPVEHAALWKIARYDDVALPDVDGRMWKSRDTSKPGVLWWDERILDLMGERVGAMEVVQESRRIAGVEIDINEGSDDGGRSASEEEEQPGSGKWGTGF